MSLFQDFNPSSVDEIRRLAEQGIAEAECQLGFLYANGEIISQDYAQALTWFRKSAEKGYAAAEYNLGLMYAQGTGVREDLNETFSWYLRAAEHGYDEAQFMAGVFFERRMEMSQAVRWWRKAAQQWHQDAARNLKMLGEPIFVDETDPNLDLKVAARCNIARAQYLLAKMHEEGSGGVPLDLVEAHKLLNIAASILLVRRIENGDPLEDQLPILVPQALQRVKSAMTPAQIAEAESRERECDDKRRHRRSEFKTPKMRPLIIDDAAKVEVRRMIGYAEANPIMINLQPIFQLFSNPETMPGYSRAQHCVISGYSCAYGIEEHPSGTYRHLSVALLDDDGDAPDPVTVDRLMIEFGFYAGLRKVDGMWMEDLGKNKVAIHVVQAMNAKYRYQSSARRTALLWEDDKGITSNKAEIMNSSSMPNFACEPAMLHENEEFFRAFFILSDPVHSMVQCDSQRRANEIDIPESPTKAVLWYVRAARGGQVTALNSIGMCYAHGHGVPQNYETASVYFQLGAEHGDMLAQFNLGLLYSAGKGVPQDINQALRWFHTVEQKEQELSKLSVRTTKHDKIRIGVVDCWYREAMAGNSDFQYRIGFHIENQNLIHVDPAQATDWYLKAAESGLAKAQLQLGKLYLSGKSVRVDPIEAYKWLTLAAIQGIRDSLVGDAQSVLKRLLPQMSKEQIAEGQNRVCNFVPVRRPPINIPSNAPFTPRNSAAF